MFGLSVRERVVGSFPARRFIFGGASGCAVRRLGARRIPKAEGSNRSVENRRFTRL